MRDLTKDIVFTISKVIETSISGIKLIDIRNGQGTPFARGTIIPLIRIYTSDNRAKLILVTLGM